MSHLGHPLIGDSLYGTDDDHLINRQALHASYLSFLQQDIKYSSSRSVFTRRL